MNLEEIFSSLSSEIPMTGITFGNLLFALIVLVVGYIFVALIVRYIRRAMKKASMADLLVEFVSRVSKILLLLVVAMVSVSVLGFDVGSGLVSISVVFGFVFGFAFQDILGNLAAGFMIALTKPFKAGDYVDAAGNSGSIENVGISNTTLLTPDNKKIIIPNSKLWGDAIINYTAMDTRRIDITVGIGYEDDIGKAIKTAYEVVKSNKKVLEDPSPLVATDELGDSSVNLIIRPWVKTGDYWPAKQELLKKIKEGFDEVGINIPYPQTFVHLSKED